MRHLRLLILILFIAGCNKSEDPEPAQSLAATNLIDTEGQGEVSHLRLKGNWRVIKKDSSFVGKHLLIGDYYKNDLGEVLYPITLDSGAVLIGKERVSWASNIRSDGSILWEIREVYIETNKHYFGPGRDGILAISLDRKWGSVGSIEFQNAKYFNDALSSPDLIGLKFQNIDYGLPPTYSVPRNALQRIN
jgi:hypothetical protein